MDQPKTDKFSELSPVLELVYVMLTNMAKYMDVYATDIEADKTEQYMEAKEAIDAAIRKFDTLYGLKSPSSSTEEPVGEFEDDMTDDDTMPTTEATVAEKAVSQAQAPTTPSAGPKSEAQPYDYASGNDPESLKKAKQAVNELKTLFADMKKQEATVVPATSSSEPTPVPVTESAPPAPVPPQVPMPTFVAPATSAPAVPTQSVSPPATPVLVPDTNPASAAPTTAPADPATAPAGDANEIDSILAELKKLQNKGTAQL